MLCWSAGVATLQRREKKVDKATDVDIVKYVQDVGSDADPTRLEAARKWSSV